MKVFVKAFTALNVGDDLFLHILFKRYKDVEFFLRPMAYHIEYKNMFEKYKNVKVLDNQQNIVEKILDRLNFPIIDKKHLEMCDICVYIGGSIFIENLENNKLDKLFLHEAKFLIKKYKPYYLLSCNFGPFYTDKYKNDRRNIFSKCADVCFREKYSYNLFSDVSSVRYSPDVAFTYTSETFKISERINNSIGFSIINIKSRRLLNKYYDIYMNSLLHLINDAYRQNKKIYLFEFCVLEDDFGAIKSLLNILTEEVKRKITIVRYDGNIDSFLSKYSSIETMVCTRLHSMILSVIFKQNFYPIAYSNKIINIIEDLKLCKKYSVLQNIIDDEGSYIKNNFERAKKEEEVKKIREAAEQQFKKLDSVLI